MTSKDEWSVPASGLRQQAEEVIRGKETQSPEGLEALSSEEMQRMLHELRVHQVELEMQNEELRRAQVELDAARSRYFNLYDLAPVCYCTLSEQGLIVEANLAAARLLGVARGALVRQPFSRFIGKENQDFYYRQRTHLLGTGEPQAYELRMIKKDGTGFWVQLNATVAKNELGEVVSCVVLIDITERKQAEEVRRRLEEQTSQRQKFEALGILAAGVAHNINNMLTIIMGTAALREELANEPEDLEAYRNIGKACRRGRDLVKSLTYFAQPTLSNQGPLELHALITEVRVLLEYSIQKGITIIEAFFGEPLWIHGDAGSLIHALVNLCFNSLDAMPNGGTLTFRTNAIGRDWVELFVEDSGEGMTPETLGHVAEPFFTTKPVDKGTGLGLSVTHGVIKAHGGFLEISSLPGQGTTVKLRIPRIPTPALK